MHLIYHEKIVLYVYSTFVPLLFNNITDVPISIDYAKYVLVFSCIMQCY